MYCRYTSTTAPLHLGRDPPMNECSGVSLTCQQCEPFPKRTLIAQEDATFMAVIGPSANPRGYTAITGDQKKMIIVYWLDFPMLNSFIIPTPARFVH